MRETLGLSKVVFVPSRVPPLKDRDLADAGHRLEMVRLAVEANPGFEVSDLECRGSGKSYTVETLMELKRRDPGMEILFILGVDAFLDIPNWHKPEMLVRLCDFVVVNRPPHDIEEILSSPLVDMAECREGTPLRIRGGGKVFPVVCTPIGISATDIRQRLRQGRSIKYLLPESVESYIISNRVYPPEEGVRA